MSGAGLSTALKSFEDLGYECVDNLRLSLIPTLIEDKSVAGRDLAIVVDTRNPGFSVEELLSTIETLSSRPDFEVKLLFLECSDEALQQRYTETRRRHPMAVDRPVTDGIRRERELLWRLRNGADQVIDTSILSIRDLRRQVMNHFNTKNATGLTLFVTSFSYRHGIPREADLVFDVRFLANPHWDTRLRPMSGLDEDVANYIRRDGDFPSFIDHMTQLLTPLLPRYQQEGKSYLTIAVGCTGGRHRSVFVAEQLTNIIASQGYIVGVGHRDMDRGQVSAKQ
ncbi:MAG: RNase adapter RapZ [Alphaproteobacteria bacterium]|nr:RNase adapter RapZ [Alphaproteobacteria bacterium]MBV8548902.1 RNase adapter RapZ [Alphaproteobacteria bacterium]